jgi:hypothetical protein
MFQLEFVAVLFKFKARIPSFVPLLQLPSRMATAKGDASRSPCYNPIFSFSNDAVSSGGRPPVPLCGYADRWQQKNGRPDAPVGKRGCVGQKQSTDTNIRPIVATTEPKGDRRDSFVDPESVASACG